MKKSYYIEKLLLFFIKKLIIGLLLEIRYINNFSEISLVIKGTGNQKFFNRYEIEPSEVFINGNLTETSSQLSFNSKKKYK